MLKFVGLVTRSSSLSWDWTNHVMTGKGKPLAMHARSSAEPATIVWLTKGRVVVGATAKTKTKTKQKTTTKKQQQPQQKQFN